MTTRLGLALSITQRHELTIDSFAPFTIDKAQVGDRFYADKAPGLSFMAVPIVAALGPVLSLPVKPYGQIGSNYHSNYPALLAVMTLAINGVALATAASLLFRWTRQRGCSVAGATFASLSFALATPVMWWATIFVGHSTATALLLIGFVLLSESLCQPSSCRGGAAGTFNRTRALIGGLALGTAFMTEFTTAPAVAIIAAGCGIEALLNHRPVRTVLATSMVAGVGLAGPLLLVAWYNTAAFGSPMHLGYQNVQDFPGMQRGFFGISLPQPGVAVSLLFGRYRGLLPLSPVLLLAPAAVFIGLRHRSWRAVSVMAVLVFVYFWFLDAGYFYWWGGDSTGPRQMLPGLALFLIPFAPLWDAVPRPVRLVALGLLVISAVFAALLAGMTVLSPETAQHPFSTVWLPMLHEGRFPRALATSFHLDGYASLLPVLVIWAVVGLSAAWTGGRGNRRAAAV